jgi:SAM-dependent methyltransferase
LSGNDLDRQRFSIIGHGDLPYWNPVSPDRLDRWLGGLSLPQSGRALDVGCGRGELPLRLVELHGCHAIGIDPIGPVIEEARREAIQRVPAGRIEFRAERFDAEDHAPGSFDLAACVGSTHAVSGLEQALRTLRELTRPGGILLIGEGYWKRNPEAGYLAFLGSERDDLRTHAGNLSLASELGLEVLRSHEATEAEWSRYEDTYAGNIENFLSRSPDDPEADLMRERIRGWREAYLWWGRTTLGFGLYLLRKPR